MRVFIDSDVVISSLLSTTGAAYFLLNQSEIHPVISNVSYEELQIVVNRMTINPEKFKTSSKQFEKYTLSQKLSQIKKSYASYVTDINDAHIVAGAKESHVKYLITYNLKHFKTDKIKSELDILLLTPALFLQYLRSQ